MTKHIFVILFSIVHTVHIIAQDTMNVFGFNSQRGKPIIQVFGNFDINASLGAQKKYAFWFGRAHFGYEYQFSRQLSGRIVLDMGRPTTVGLITVTDADGNTQNATNTSKEGSYYTMTLKFASLEWKPNDHFKVQAGGILQNHYITQEKFWGYRYLAETFQDRYYKIPSSDLGFIACFIANKKVGFDLALTNGEGFRFDQDPYGDIKLAGGINIIPINNLQTRFYYDHTSSSNPAKPAIQQLLSFFAGYKLENKFRFGGEYNYRINHLNISDHDLFGWSLYGSYSVWKNMEIFARFDQLQANKINYETKNWYYQNTGKAYIMGIHSSLTRGTNISLNYQGWQPENSNLKFQHHLLMSFEFRI